MRIRRLIPAAVLAVLAAQPAPARAEEYFIDVQASGGCGDPDELSRELRVLTAKLDPMRPDQTAHRFIVRLRSTGPTLVVDLESIDPNGERSSRSFPARSCAEAVQASAWILTLLIDPDASTSEPKPRNPPVLDAVETAPAEPSLVDPGAKPTAVAPTSVSSLPRAPVVTATPAALESHSQHEADASPSRFESQSVVVREGDPWELGVGGTAGVQHSALPGIPIGFGGFVDVGLRRSSWLSPLLRFGLLDAGSGTTAAEGRGRVNVSLFTGRAWLCPVRGPAGRRYLGRVCALSEFGRISGAGLETLDAASKSAPWASLGLALGAGSRLADMLGVELEAALLFPLVRDRFVFEPEPVEVGYRVPAVSTGIAISLVFYPRPWFVRNPPSRPLGRGVVGGL